MKLKWADYWKMFVIPGSILAVVGTGGVVYMLLCPLCFGTDLIASCLVAALGIGLVFLGLDRQ